MRLLTLLRQEYRRFFVLYNLVCDTVSVARCKHAEGDYRTHSAGEGLGILLVSKACFYQTAKPAGAPYVGSEQSLHHFRCVCDSSFLVLDLHKHTYTFTLLVLENF